MIDINSEIEKAMDDFWKSHDGKPSVFDFYAFIVQLKALVRMVGAERDGEVEELKKEIKELLAICRGKQ
jgi:hypothetical protein